MPEQYDLFLNFHEVRRLTGGKSRSTLWRWCRDGRFPKPERIGPNSIAWRQSAVSAWVKDPSTWANREGDERNA